MKNNQQSKNNKALLPVLFRSLVIAIPMVPLTVAAMPSSSLNLCSRLSYEAPDGQNLSSVLSNYPVLLSEEPLPEQQQPPSALIVPVDGTVNVRLVNQTNTEITYEVIGDTEPRRLEDSSNVMLQTLKLPVTITFQRPQGGLLSINLQPSEPGILAVNLTEATSLEVDKKALRIQASGAVFLN